MGCRRHYIPGLSEESKSLYEAYTKQYMSNPFDSTTLDTGNELISKMTAENKRITSTDLTGNSRKAWQTIRNISNDPTASEPPCLVTANQVVHQLLVKLPPISEDDSSLVFLFTEEEYKKGIATLKNKKAAGIDDVLVEQLNNLGPRAHRWLHSMLNVCFTENRIPKVWRQSKIIALLKPGKDSAIPKSHIPISLLCHMYKLSPGKSCCSQLLNLTQHIEDGYQRGMITGAAFVDLSAAFDTVNHRLLLRKLYYFTDDSPLCRVIQNMLSSRRCYVELNNDRSRWRNKKNGLPQGSVLFPILFNIYTND